MRPKQVVPWRWQSSVVITGLLLLTLFGGVRFLPQLDPFGQVRAADEQQEQKKLLDETRKATTLRLAEVRKEPPGEAESEEVQKAIEHLQETFHEMKPRRPKENLQRLTAEQKVLGEEWRKLSAEKLKELFNQKSTAQEFGEADQDLLRKWTKDLQQGSTESVEKELSELRQDLERLTKTEDPVKRAEQMRQVRKRAQALSNLAKNRVDSKPLTAALNRAMEQLELARTEALSDDALKAASESLQLAKVELQEIAQSVKI